MVEVVRNNSPERNGKRSAGLGTIARVGLRSDPGQVKEKVILPDPSRLLGPKRLAPVADLLIFLYAIICRSKPLSIEALDCLQ